MSNAERSVTYSRRRNTAVLVALAPLALTACGQSVSGDSQPVESKTFNPLESATAAAPRPTYPFPGKIVLSAASCKQWGIDRPQPTSLQDGKLLTVTDARRSIPANCDPIADEGAGTYTDASYKSPIFKRADGSTHIPDGVVLQVVSYKIGQFACNDSGGSTVWLGVKEATDSQTAFVPVINTGGGPDLNQLAANQIPELPTEYAGTTAGGC